MNKSIPKGTALDFINVQPLNPLISRCEIKVLYTGKNRNGSFFSKEVANKMANSLPGTPIVGQYLLQAGDFGDHGEDELVIDEHGVRFIKDTVPFGFVPTDAKVWWADFTDVDGVTREYMVTEGYLWTGRYPEVKRVVERGNGQSMELDRDTLTGEWSKVEGQWSKFDNEDREYFIVSDATFSALCILGEEVEPCFEGANITKNSNLVYSLNKDDFKEKMLDFMEDLKLTLNDFSYEGGTKMPEENLNVETPVVVEEPVVEEVETAEEDFAKKKKDEEEKVKVEVEVDKEDDSKDDSEDDTEDDDSDDEEDKKKKKKNFAKEEDKKDEEEDEEKKKDFAAKEDEEEDKKKCGYSLEEVVEYQELLVKHNELQANFEAVQKELDAIKPEYSKLKEAETVAYEKAKDEMINSFYMLSEADKAEVIENKANFSLDEIEAKLSVICVRNKVNFSLDEAEKNEDNTETPITTFNVDNTFDSTPAWVKAVARVAETRK